SCVYCDPKSRIRTLFCIGKNNLFIALMAC
ncbi:MAG: hypothetical protein ACI917_000427, partial [Patiriisocius sp.]